MLPVACLSTFHVIALRHRHFAWCSVNLATATVGSRQKLM
jgi:hypothetical protein